MKLIPNTIFARLFALVVMALVVSHVMTFVLLFKFFDRDFPPGPPPHMRAHAGQMAEPDGFMRRPPPPMWEIGGYTFRPLPPGLWIGLIVQFITLTATAWFGARFLARPMQQVAHASAQLAKNLYSVPMKEQGPDEARQTARVFNDMQHKVRGQIEERERFVAAVSHDLRTPLTRMKLRIENLSENYAKQKLRDDIGEMADMLDATLDYLRERVSTEPLQLLDVQSLIEVIAEDAGANGDKVSMSGTAEPLFTRPIALRRCLSNLVENALRYGQEAVITLRDTQETLVIEVQDRGPGIPPDKMAAVFEPFVRLDPSRNKAYGGVGLGLSIAREAAIQCDGRLTLRNAPEGGLIASIAITR
ncbi:ATP-binding protein [Herminiimonas arsenitoxidans]|uniref:ATP-binding protein n=1 Tax=Herminiimonas arsenitoxidans TaxID=1809410 RepID=UPI0009714C34|nr:ATP-binding protein [Herminiimonas arsenitoxidans]